MSPTLPPQAKKVFAGILTTVYQWPQTMYDGSVQTFECYVRPDTVAVIAFLDPATIVLTHQEQPARSEAFWDPPGGRADEGETLEQAARRELLEETGFHAGRLEAWNVNRWDGLVLFNEGTFIATDLTYDPSSLHPDVGEKIKVVSLKLEDAVRMCLKGQLRRADVALAILGMYYDPEQRERLEKYLIS